ncbi:hypothetical protein VCHA53O468_140021 [Vibrio chagasii]|nr:hypothetical protein VCHA53O468_140021 [Vibrio chagasii]CAH7182792.1 hypothetical protein VCHA43P274_120114 [Vibrio chagasii]
MRLVLRLSYKITNSKFDGADSNQFITKKLAQSFGISKIIMKSAISA